MKIVRKTIGQMFNEIAKKVPNREALIHTDVNVRYNYSSSGKWTGRPKG
jgi:hypothetical protein